jgi:hypothetical protein
MPAMLRPLQRRPLFQIKYQPKRGIPIQIIPMQSLTPNKPQPLIQFQTRRIADFSFQDDFIGVPGGHGVDGEAHEVCGYAAAAVGFLGREHGDVAAVGTAAVGFELGDYNAY